MKFCCKRFEEEAKTIPTLLSGGRFTPEEGHPAGRIEYVGMDEPDELDDDPPEDFAWVVNGCCGDCYVLTGVKFCPFCGARLPIRVEIEHLP